MKKLIQFYENNRAAVILCLIGFFFYSFLILYRYIHLAYTDWDMAYLNQCLWNLSHGKLYSSLYGYNCFGDHSTFINLLAVPIFALFQHPLTFSFFQIFLFILSAQILYLLILEDIGKFRAFIITFLYITFPPNLLALIHDCNPESLSPFFLLTTIFFYKRKQLGFFYVSTFFLILIKENMPLIVMMMSFWGLLAKDRSRIFWGLIPLIFSLGYFLIAVNWIIPYFLQMDHHSLWTRFNHLGPTPKEAFYNLFHFSILKKNLIYPANINFIISLFGILLIPAFLSPSKLFLILPILGYHLLSNHMPEKSIYYSYALTMTPIIFLSATQTLKKIKRWPYICTFLCLFFLVISLLQIYILRKNIAYKIGINTNKQLLSKKWNMLKKIPSNSSVIATFEFLPALSLRDKLYSFHKVYSKFYQEPNLIKLNDFNTGKIFKTPSDAQYAIINFSDSWLQISLQDDHKYTRDKLDTFFTQWTEIDSSGTIKLYKRKLTNSF